MPNVEPETPANVPSSMGVPLEEVMRRVGSVVWRPAVTAAGPSEGAEHNPSNLIALHLKLTPKDHPPVPPGKFFGYYDGRWMFQSAQDGTVCYLVPRTPEEERDLEANRLHVANLAYALWRFEYGCEHLANLWPAWGRKKVSRQLFVKVGLEFRRYASQGDWNVNSFGLNFDGSWTIKPNEINETKRKAGEEQKFAVVTLPIPGMFMEEDITDQMEFSEIKAPLPIPAPR